MQHTVSFANTWLIAVDGARRRIPGYAALLIAVATLAASLLGGAAAYRALPDLVTAFGAGELGPILDRLALYGCSLGLLVIVAVAAMAYEARAPIGARRRAAPAALVGLAVGVLGFLAATGVAAALGAVRPGAGGTGAGGTGLDHRLSGLAIGAVLILIQAGAEELFFRGWLQPLLGARWGAWIGLGVTAVLFGAAHVVAGPISPIAVINDILAGAVFGLLALRSGGLVAPILGHWGWNWSEQSLLGLTPNPGVDPLGSLFDLDLTGPPLLSGGADEMNGSLAATAALLALLAITALWRSRLVARG